MDSKLKHIVRWVYSKGIKIVRSNNGLSYFDRRQPGQITICRYGVHKLTASILHEYYHNRQNKRGQWRKDRTLKEYRCEAFAIRCHKKLNIVYDRRFIDENWEDFCLDSTEYYYYNKAYKLLIKNRVL